jgi:hypothetical protein
MPFTKLSSKWHKSKRMSKEKEEELVRKVRFMFVFILEDSGSFLRRQLSIDNYHVKKYVKESQFMLFSRQKVYNNAKFVYITEIL